MPSSWLEWVVLGLLTIFFIFGGVVNLVGPKPVVNDFRRWGYPSWFNLVTGVVELATAILLVVSITRPLGAALGLVTMLAAVATLVRHREYVHAVPALIVIGLLSFELTL